MPRPSKPRPRRDPGAGTVFERTTKTRQGKVITRYVAEFELPPTADRPRRKKTVYGKSRQDALERMQKAKQTYAAIGNLPTSDPTLAQWCALWLDEHGRKRKPGSLKSHRGAIDNWIVPTIGRHRLSRLTPDHVRLLHRELRDAGKAANTVARVHAVLSVVLTDAAREDRVIRNVAKIAGGPGKGKTVKSWLDVDEAWRVLEAASPDRLGTMWLAALCLGLRQGERLGLRWSHVDLDGRKVDVAWSLTEVPWAHGCGKTCGHRYGSACPDRLPGIEPTVEQVHLEANWFLLPPKAARHVVPLPGFMVEPLRHRYAIVLTERAGYKVDHDLVWCRPDGGPIRHHIDRQIWRDLIVDAGVKRVSIHEARHTTATLLMELGVEPRVISEIVGHSDMITTEGYKHVSLDAARRALDSLGTALGLPSTSG